MAVGPHWRRAVGECVGDIRDKLKIGGNMGKSTKSVGKFNPPEGKFIEKPHEKIGRERGREVCDACYGTCAATHHLQCYKVWST